MSRLAVPSILIVISVAVGCAGLRPLHQKTIDEAIRHLEQSPSAGKNRSAQSDANKPKHLEQENSLASTTSPSSMPKEASVASSDPIKIPRATPAQGGLKTVSSPATPEPQATPIPVETTAMPPAKPEVPAPLSLKSNDENLYTLQKSIRPAMPTVATQASDESQSEPEPPGDLSPAPRPALKAVAESSALLKPPAMMSPMAETSKNSESLPEKVSDEPSFEGPPRALVVDLQAPQAEQASVPTDETEVVIDEAAIEKPLPSPRANNLVTPPVAMESKLPVPVVAMTRAAEHLDRATKSQQAVVPEQREPLRLDRMHFCTEIMGFGQTEPVEKNEFRPDQRLMLYVEVQNFASRADGRLFETSLTSQVIVTNKEGQLVFTHQFDKIVDRCHERRHEFFCHYVFDLPESLAAGDYKVTLLLYDEQSHQTAAQSIDLLVNPSSAREKEGLRP